LEFDTEKFSSLIEVPKIEGLKEINEVKEHFDRFGKFIPNELESQRIELEKRLHKEA
jgi:GTP-dependent phosphoenolpyruvate carboxykinase